MNPQITSAVFLLSVFILASANAAKTKSTVKVSSPCTIAGSHGVARWTVKTDAERPPRDKSQITEMTPSQMFAWPGIGTKVKLNSSSNKRLASEQRWYALTGRVTGMKIEADGDLHIELEDANGNKVGTVGAEVPPGRTWCEFRKLALSWTSQKYPFSFTSSKKLTVIGRHVITVTGKAFYDVDHAPKNRSNARGKPFKAGYSVWEIHPVMGMTR